jgi:hypothetical protein
VSDDSTTGYYFWKGVPSTYILGFIEMFQNHPASYLNEKGPLKEYIEWLEDRGGTEWDVLLVNPQDVNNSRITKYIGGVDVRAQLRTAPEQSKTPSDNGVALNKRRVASRGLEKAGLTQAQVEEAQNEYKKENGRSINIPDRIYRTVRERPLLMLHLLDIQDESSQSMFEHGIAAYGISFPGNPGVQRPEKLVQYVVNTVWWNNMYSEMVEDITDELGIDE